MRRKGTPAFANNGAAAISKALRQEKLRYEHDEGEKFSENRQAERDKESHQKFPRTLENGTFFTPHLARSLDRHNGDIVREYAAVLKVNGKWITTRPTFNPVSARSRTLLTADQRELPQVVRSEFLALESKGFSYLGRSKELHVFERLYNRRQRDRPWVFKSAVAFSTSVACLTVFLFTGEYLF